MPTGTQVESDAEGNAAVDVRGLHCRYGDFEAVRGIDLSVQRGRLLAILGTNGAGKTTVLDTLQGLRPADEGRVRVLGLDPGSKRRRLAARTGTVMQEAAHPDQLTPTEFLRLIRGMTPRTEVTEVNDDLEQVGLAHRADVRIAHLSGGERRRLDLAAAIGGSPDLLFLDEPTAGLDPESRFDTWELIRRSVGAGTTVVLTTHYLEEAEALADEIVILHEGRIVVEGTLEEIVANRAARIRFHTTDGMPPDRFAGDLETKPERDGHRIEIRTTDLTGDLATLLAWADDTGNHLRRLSASEPTLAEVFADIRTDTTPEEALQ